MHIGTAYLALAAKIQEAALAMCHEDIRTRLRDAVNAAYPKNDDGRYFYCYVVAVFGDDKSGDVVYSCNDELKKAPYTMATGGATIDIAAAVDVVPLTTYELETAGVALGEAGARNSKRDLMQLQTIHDAASAMGANCSMKEAAKPGAVAPLKLTEGSGFLEAVTIREGVRSSYPILMISPGTGSSAHYPKEVLKKAAENGVFKKGSFMYWNHPTAAQESARPEGDLDNLAAITTSDGEYMENGVKGPGVYATAKPMADYAEKIATRAEHIGLSIRAGGTATGRTVDGKPELATIDYLESVDYVTKAGRGGMALAESERFTRLLEEFNFNEGELSDMEKTELQLLKEGLAAQTAINTSLMRRALRGDAMELGAAFLRSTSLNEAAKLHVLENVLGPVDAPREIPVNESGAMNAARLTELFTTESKRVGAFAASLTGGSRVTGMGNAPQQHTETADEIKTREAQEARHEQIAKDAFTTLMGDVKLGEVAARGRAA